MLSDKRIQELRKHFAAFENRYPENAGVVKALDELAALRSFAYDCILDMRYCGNHERLVRIGIGALGVKDLSADTYADAPRREP